MSNTVYVLNGPNLNLLGEREPETYGVQTLDDIAATLKREAKALGVTIDMRQTNSEAELIDWVHEARKSACGVVLNAAGLTHTSVALHDALKMLDKPLIEVHLSNIYKREPFRHHSYVSPVADAVICGLGGRGYSLALAALADMINR